MFNWFKSRPKQQGLVGIALSQDGIALAHMNVASTVAQTGASRFSALRSIEFIPCENRFEDQLKALRDRVEALGLLGVPCNLVMSSGQYQLLLVEAPNVPASELSEAMRFRVRDLINIPLDAAVIDATLLPGDAGRGSQNMAYVTAIEKNKLLPVIDLVTQAGLYLQTIDVEEMALRNLAVPVAEEGRAVAVLKLQPGGGLVSLVRDGFLYFARRFELAYSGGLLDDLPEEALALELQRSLDYFERQMGQAPPTSVFVCGENISEDKITEGLRQSLAVPLKLLPLSEWGESVVIEEGILQLCAPALGGALRMEAVNDA